MKLDHTQSDTRLPDLALRRRRVSKAEQLRDRARLAEHTAPEQELPLSQGLIR